MLLFEQMHTILCSCLEFVFNPKKQRGLKYCEFSITYASVNFVGIQNGSLFGMHKLIEK